MSIGYGQTPPNNHDHEHHYWLFRFNGHNYYQMLADNTSEIWFQINLYQFRYDCIEQMSDYLDLMDITTTKYSLLIPLISNSSK